MWGDDVPYTLVVVLVDKERSRNGTNISDRFGEPFLVRWKLNVFRLAKNVA